MSDVYVVLRPFDAEGRRLEINEVVVTDHWRPRAADVLVSGRYLAPVPADTQQALEAVAALSTGLLGTLGTAQTPPAAAPPSAPAKKNRT